MEQRMDLNEQQARRLEKAQELRRLGIDPYTPRSERTHTAREALERFTALEPTLAGQPDPEEVVLTGRVVAVRDMGKSVFSHIRDGSGAIQIYL
ncbi:MAG: lysine--tRNA ligase, partial [Thermomicrobiaceae bacterium]|nr:lysine--tRNA ligase [Thermomicrobiaceae bacterium]